MNNNFIYFIMLGGFALNIFITFFSILKMTVSLEHRITKIEDELIHFNKDINRLFEKIREKI